MIVASIAAGVSLLVATRAISQTMDRAALATATPLAGTVDLIITNGETPVDQNLARELRIPGVATAWPRIFENVDVQMPDESWRTVLLVGIDALAEREDAATPPWQLEVSGKVTTLVGSLPFAAGKGAIFGKGLDAALGAGNLVTVRTDGKPKKDDWTKLQRLGIVDAHGPAASLGGNVMIVQLPKAAAMLGLPPGKVHRIDLTLQPTANRDQVRKEVERIVAGRADVRTPDEQNQAVQNVMSGMQTALQLCGIAALVVGLFLVYNALSVAVAERRHEIGILLAVGATRGQIRRLFAGEAALMGLTGSLLGIPLGVGFAYLALEPVRTVLQEIFFNINAGHVEVDGWLIGLALFAGLTTAVGAALMPAIQASRENPAEAVRRMPVAPTWRYRFAQIVTSAVMFLVGMLLVMLRDRLPPRLGMYIGLGLVVVASLLAMPLLTALIARGVQPLFRRFLGLEARLAADNLVRSPGRTGIVIAALAAGVALFMQTAGTVDSNRVAIGQWVDDSIGADIVVTSGSPVSAGGKSKTMDVGLAKELEQIPGVERALPVRMRKPIYNGTQVFMIVIDADDYLKMDSQRERKIAGLDLFEKLAHTKNGVIVSDNFAALHGVGAGDVIPLTTHEKLVKFTIIGTLPDYSWNHGSLFVNRKDYEHYWHDRRVDVFDIYLRGDATMETKRRVQEEILKKHGAEHGLFVLTREEMKDHIDGIIHRLYGIAYGQQLVVLFVAALGVVTALLISVLQRRREMGLLRAIGGSRWHVIRCVLAEAALMGLIGSVIGFLVGIPLEWFSLNVVILEETGYTFPLVIPWQQALLIAAAAVLVATLAGLGPSLYAVRQRIPEAIAME
jgi:putative ABC transport system permease protein